jgi:ATP adenylyltransferase
MDAANQSKSLQAPWRLHYLEAMSATEKKSGPPTPGTGSFLRDFWLDDAHDDKNLVIVRARVCPTKGLDGASDAEPSVGGMILLNAYPYSNGHLLVALGDARPTLLDYDPAQRAALWRLTEVATDLMQRALEPQGINLGINQGRAAGAGVPQHLHVHLVPRWGGDVNFMTVVGQVRVMPASLEAMAERYRKVWQAMRGEYGI